MDFNRLKYHFDKVGVTPSIVLDIGACYGNWCKEVKKMYPNATIHQFEANKAMASKLEGVFDIVLLGDRYQDATPYYKGGNQHGNGIYREQSVYYENAEVEYLTMHTLDEVLGNKYEHIDLMKADVQGCELDVLRGGSSTIAKTDLILLEVSFLPYNQGAPLATEVFSYMDQIGFQSIDILEKHYYGDIFIQADILFARKGSKYITTYFA